MPRRSDTDNIRIIPKHIGIIMDGNRRWAKKRGLPVGAGHLAGAETFQRIVRYCEKSGVSALTVFAFSTENWSRQKEEVDSIMDILRRYLNDAFGFKDDNIKITFIGERDRLDTDIIKLMDEIEETSKDRTGLRLNIAVNYGGRQEIIRASKIIAKSILKKEAIIEEIDEDYFNGLMYTKESPPLDIVLRSGGEQRISNFMLWQCAYSEFVSLDKLWPDFSDKDMEDAINIYSRRSRRYGGV